MGEKFDTGVADTSGKFATGVVDTGGNFAVGDAPCFANISANFWKIWNGLKEYSGAGGKLNHEKNQKQKIS